MVVRGVAFLFCLGVVLPVGAGDWPTYAHDAARTGVSRDRLVLPLTLAWTHAASPPRPAWPEPAKRDLYNKVFDLEARMTFDHAHHVAVVGDALFFGSSADDQVRCLDSRTGEVRWSFFTEGPVRLAPTVHEGRVFVASDDGHVYCLGARDGEELWRHRPGPRDHRVPGNGRMISLWPIRTGVVVAGELAYACAGVFPSETVYLCAMNVKSGEEAWKTPMSDLPAQGYLLASPRRLYVTTGRDRPVVFDRESGRRLYQVRGGGGGTYALLVGDSLVYGPGKTGQMAVFDPGERDQLATFAGQHMLVHEGRSYLQSKDQLTALDRVRYLQLARERRDLSAERRRLTRALENLRGRPPEELLPRRKKLDEIATRLDAIREEMQACTLWTARCERALSLILTRDHVVAGGDGEVSAYSKENGERVWHERVRGKVHGLAVASGRLFVSTDTGAIHAFAGEQAR